MEAGGLVRTGVAQGMPDIDLDGLRGGAQGHTGQGQRGEQGFD
jgi:hypothetical protein